MVNNGLQRIPNNNGATSSAAKLQYISIGIRVIRLFIGISFIIMDVIAIRSHDLKHNYIVKTRINAWVGAIVSHNDLLLIILYYPHLIFPRSSIIYFSHQYLRLELLDLINLLNDHVMAKWIITYNLFKDINDV